MTSARLASGNHRIPKDDFWTIALGSGLRWTIDQMGAEAASEIKQGILDTLSARRIERIATNVIYAVAQERSASA